MATITIYLIAAISIIQFLKETNNSCKQGYIIADCIDIHCEIQAVPFLRPFSCKRAEFERAQLSQMQPGEPSAGYLTDTCLTAQDNKKTLFDNIRIKTI